jgi:two-component system, sensor histidine kinase and response regulator
MRERSELSATRIVLLTSGDRPGDSERFRDLALDAYLLKPVPQDELLETIHQVMSRAEGDASLVSRLVSRHELTTREPAADGFLYILVAEDNELNSRLLQQMLERRGHHVTVVKNGKLALEFHARERFDLIFLDLHMPEVDGFQVIKAIREREAHQGGHIPVIALTARSRKEDRERGLAAGMDVFLTKPLSPRELWPAIEHLVAGSVGQVSTPLISPDVVLDACGGEEEILVSMCQTFQARLPEQMAALRNALDTREAGHLRDAAHQLRGTVATFSTRVGDIASEVEDHAANGDLEPTGFLIGQLEVLSRSLLLEVSGLSIKSLSALRALGRRPT